MWLAAALLALPAAAPAADVSVIGVFPGKGAVLVIDGGAPQSLRLGQKSGGLILVSVDKSGAVLDDAGQRRTVALGQHVTSGAAPTGRAPRAMVIADGQGQFTADATVNGNSIRFLVDTGASQVVLPSADARRLGVDFSKAAKSVAQTANGSAPVYLVKLDTVKVGEIELHNVDAIIVDSARLSQALLGMSFLNRVEMRREGDSMLLVRRF